VYRLFIDEVGHHNLATANDPKERYLCLVGIILDLEYAYAEFTNRLDVLKIEIFGTDEVVLHRRELINKTPAPFDRLKDDQVRQQFDGLLLEFIRTSKFVAITVLIDKKKHLERYAKWRFHPYHYCLTAMLERYVLWLDDTNSVGDVMAEARDKKQNMKLEAAYEHIFRRGTGFADRPAFLTANRIQARLTSGQIKLKGKAANIAGLQLVDVIANPARRHLLCEIEKEPMTSEFGLSIVDILYKSKYRRNSWTGAIDGYGVKLLP